ncbi:hypothetical protein CC80DRAFT_536633 [Byssothecium circinans]|uniref:Xaa-Pro aminopeptidase n=1 Tax=Byssothecium circinans TaxID=147558 RepID=A0A6A5TSX7_9PLEO|nr:hypothetical protein CC80DRAFT_536633 [Byssothecium circinans]
MPPPDATQLAARLQGLRREEYWVHVEANSPLEKYPAKHHARRVRDRLDVAQGLIYLPGAPARNNEDSDMPAPFRQRRYFYYLSGCNEANCHLTYDIQHDILALFIPRINPGRVFWNGRGSTPAEAMDKYDIDEVHYVDELQRELLEWQFRYTGDFYVLHEDQLPRKPSRYINLDTTSLQPAMDLTRMIKDEHEIKLIRKANDISSDAHKQVLANITKFKNEAQVEGLFMDVCISQQAKHQAYDPIAASGPNAGTLHYDANNEDFGNRQLMCLDAGCEFENYASDITRTFPLSGSWPSSESQNIYKLVQRMQEACIERLAPGVRYLDLHILAHQIAIDGLLQLGILYRGTKEEIYKAGTSRAFFPHGLGHHVGLEVHDVGQKDLMSLYEKNPKFEKAPSLYPEDFHLPVYDNEMCRAPTSPESPHLEEGMVVTVEPGIYFSAYALNHFYLHSPIHSKYINVQVVQKYLPVGGVRIEDDILITSKGYENLTTAPKGEEMLRIIQNQTGKPPVAVVHEKSETLRSPKVVDEEPLMLAPGISKRMSEPKFKPVSRASTMPVTRSVNRKSSDFEPFQGPSLFSGFKQPTPIEGMGNNATKASIETANHRIPIKALCGVLSNEPMHIYDAQHMLKNGSFIANGSWNGPSCRNCRGIFLDLLGSQLRGGVSPWEKHDKMPKSRTGASEGGKVEEMRQIRPRASCHLDLFRPISQPYKLPEGRDPFAFGTQRGLEQEIRSKASVVPAQTAQRRSVTFDSYITDERRQVPPVQKHPPPSTNPWHHTIPPQHRPKPQDVHPQAYEPASYNQHTSTQRGLSATFDRERDLWFQPLNQRPTQPPPTSRRLTSHPSMPILRPSDPIQPQPYRRSPQSTYSHPTLYSASGFQPLNSAPAYHPRTHQTHAPPNHIIPGSPRPQSIPRIPSFPTPSAGPARPTSLASTARSAVSRNPWSDAATAVSTALPTYEEHMRALRDQKMDELRRAMEMVWRVKEDVERGFGEALGAGGGGSRREREGGAM